MRDDLDFEGTAQENGALGLDIFDEGFNTAPVPDEVVYRQLPPIIDHALVEVISVEPRETKDKTNVSAHFGIKFLTGPEGTGTVGRVEFLDKYLKASLMKKGETRSNEEYNKAKQRVADEWKRGRYVLELGNAPGANATLGDLAGWLAPSVGKQIVIKVGHDKSSNIPKINSFMDSWRKPTDPAKDAKGAIIPGKTWADLAKEAAANFGKRGAKRGGGLTARDLGSRRDELA